MREGLLPFFIFLGIILLSLLKGRKKEERVVAKKTFSRKKPSVFPKPSLLKVSTEEKGQKFAPIYQVEKKKQSSCLQKNWQGKRSLKQAFILSEVLKKADEREFF